MNHDTGSIPLVVLEEHHEAFYVWHSARRSGWTEQPITLLHVDSHADMTLPCLRTGLQAEAGLAEIASFTYRELDTTSFIWPAVYHGLFNRVLHLRHAHPRSALGWRRLAISAEGELDQHLVLTTLTPSSSHATALSAGRVLDYARITPQNHIDTDQSIVLDIDLDYFCCNEYPRPTYNEVEITERHYREFQQNPYHCVRLSPLKVSAITRNGCFYLLFFDHEPPPASAQQQVLEIDRRMRDFIAGLEANSVRPSLISVCRSRHSGYTPAHLVAYIETLLVDKLGQLYNVKLFSLGSLLTGETTAVSALRQESVAIC